MYWTVWPRAATLPNHGPLPRLAPRPGLWRPRPDRRAVGQQRGDRPGPARHAVTRLAVGAAMGRGAGGAGAVRVARPRRHRRAFCATSAPLAVFALVGFAPQTYLIYVGLVGSSAINLGLLNSAIPVLIVVVAALLHRRRPRRLEMTSLALSLTGVVVIIARGQWSTLASLRVQRPRPRDAARHGRVGATTRFGCAARRRAPVPGVHVRRGPPRPRDDRSRAGLRRGDGSHRDAERVPREWAFAYLGALPTLVAMLLFAYAIRDVGPVQAGLSTHLVPVFAARARQVLFLDERLHRSTRRASRSSPVVPSSGACAPTEPLRRRAAA